VNAIMNFGLLDYLIHFAAIAVMILILAAYGKVPFKERDEDESDR